MRRREPGDGLGPCECYDLNWVRNTFTGHTVQYGVGAPSLHDCNSTTLYFQLCCQICEPITTGLAPIRAPGNLGTTAANIAQSWKSFLESAEKSADDDAAAQRALALLKSDRVCHLVVTRALESLLIAARVEMELRVRDLACPVYLGAIVDRTAPQKYLADERMSVLRLLHYNLKLSPMVFDMTTSQLLHHA